MKVLDDNFMREHNIEIAVPGMFVKSLRELVILAEKKQISGVIVTCLNEDGKNSFLLSGTAVTNTKMTKKALKKQKKIIRNLIKLSL